MLAISATDTLSLLDLATLKQAPPSIPPCLSLAETAISSAWSSDNASLFLASARAIHKYDPASNSLKEIYTIQDTDSVSHLLCKEKSTLIYSAAEKIHILECGSVPKVSLTISSHKNPITSISISNDSSLLASTSSNAVHVHNLTLGSYTVLRGLALAGQIIATSTFHPHSRTRLLLGIGKNLVVYDTTRPSAPLKTISLNETTSGDIIAVACSPFSKTLVAVASASGNVGLIDLEKEKGLFRTLNLKVPLTSVCFSPEGAAIHLGTEHGKLLIMDLRALDKPPKTITISDTACRIETMAIQKKASKGMVDPSARPNPNATATKPTPDTNPPRRPSVHAATKAAPSPVRARVGRENSTPARRVPSTVKGSLGGPSKTPIKKSNAEPEEKKVFSPVRDPLGNSIGDISVQIETLSAMRGTKKVTPVKNERKTSISTSHARLSSSPRASPSSSKISAASAATTRIRQAPTKESEPPRRTRTVPTTSRTRTTTAAEPTSVGGSSRLTVPGETLQVHEQIRSRSRAASSASRAGSDAASAISGRSARASSSASRPGSSTSRIGSSPIPPVPTLPVSRTPSPDLPDVNLDPITPLPVKKARMQVLGLGTPEVDQWIRAGKGGDREDKKDKGKGKVVGFKEEDDGESVNGDSISLAMQVSPRRPGVGSSTSWEASPVRVPVPGSPAGVSGGNSAHDLLRTIVKDVMYDFQRETKAEMTGLHLDLLRMGRGWKRELRSLMEEYAGGMDDLKEENRRLRAENELLRRGY